MLTLSNSSEPVPETFYVFTNVANWITKHNLEFTKGITSASIGEIMKNEKLKAKYLDGSINYLQYTPNAQVDIHGLSLYSLSATRDYRIEYNCEIYRRSNKFLRLNPSRMSCVFAFGDYETCQKVSDKYGWDIDSVKKFKLLSIPLTRVAKVNMEVISLMRSVDHSTFTPENQDIIWNHYWSGKGNMEFELPKDGSPDFEKVTSGVLWEYLIEGRLELI